MKYSGVAPWLQEWSEYVHICVDQYRRVSGCNMQYYRNMLLEVFIPNMRNVLMNLFMTFFFQCFTVCVL